MKNWLTKHRELISYVFWGAATTVVNYIVYFAATELVHIYYVAANVAAWVLAVAFAFVVNKGLVFRSKSWAAKTVLPELWKFVSARALSGALETGILFLFVTVLQIPHQPVKLAAGIVVILLNYAVSKLLIFKK